MLRDQAAHVWDPRPFDDLDGKTIGVVGMGPIAREIIRLAAALGMRPIGMRRAVLGDEPCETWTLDRLAELAGRAPTCWRSPCRSPTTPAASCRPT